MCVRSSARVNRTGAWKDEATVCPGSAARFSTMPSTGEMMRDLVMSVWVMAMSALATSMSACAATTPASARDCAARAVSRSWVEDTPRALSFSERW